MPKRLTTLMYIFGLALVTLLIVVMRPAGSRSWSSEHEIPVAQCDGYEVWMKAVTQWQRREFFSREDNSLRVTDLLEDWDATYFNRGHPATAIRNRATGIGENLELTTWMIEDQVVRVEEKGNPFRLSIPGMGSLVLKASRGGLPEQTRFDAAPEGLTGTALCAALEA